MTWPERDCLLLRRRVAELVQYMRDGVFVDSQTESVTLNVVLYNRVAGMAGVARVELTRQPAGGIAVDAESDLTPYVAHQYTQGSTGTRLRLYLSGLSRSDDVSIRNCGMKLPGIPCC